MLAIQPNMNLSDKPNDHQPDHCVSGIKLGFDKNIELLVHKKINQSELIAFLIAGNHRAIPGIFGYHKYGIDCSLLLQNKKGYLTFQEYMSKGGGLPLNNVPSIIKQLNDLLCHIHSRNIGLNVVGNLEIYKYNEVDNHLTVDSFYQMTSDLHRLKNHDRLMVMIAMILACFGNIIPDDLYEDINNHSDAKLILFLEEIGQDKTDIELRNAIDAILSLRNTISL